MRAYYDAHRSEFDRPGRGVLSIVSISRRPTAADTAGTLEKVRAIRDELVKGAKFDAVAERESDDTTSALRGGDLGRSVRGTYVKQFDDAVFSLPVGTLSQPIKTDYGYHLVRVDRRTADTVFAHHILKLVRQGDSAAVRTDRIADTLANVAGGATTPEPFDAAAQQLNLLVSRINVTQGQPAEYLGSPVPSASAWAFTGARPGESSDLFDDENGYYLVRLDSLFPGGVQPLDRVRDEIRDIVARTKAIDAAMPSAVTFSQAAARTTLEAAAKDANRPVAKDGPFARSTPVFAFGFVSQATGAAFTLPLGVVSAPVRTDEAILVMRVDRRVMADSAEWAVQKDAQRAQVTNAMREQRVRLYLENLRNAAKIDDRRAAVNALQRRQAAIEP